jgi:hypothetical protein
LTKNGTHAASQHEEESAERTSDHLLHHRGPADKPAIRALELRMRHD